MSNSEIKILPPNRLDVIEGRSLIIKPISVEEVSERYVNWLNDPQVNQFLEVRHHKQNIVSVINYINFLRSKKGCELFAIFTKKEHLHIGNIAITDYNPNNQRYAVFGMIIGDIKAQELGLGGQAMALLIDYLFIDPLIIKIKCGVIAENEKSWKTIEAIGFKRESVLRQRSVLASGKITDVYPYGLLREEWYEKRKIYTLILKDLKISSRKTVNSPHKRIDKK